MPGLFRRPPQPQLKRRPLPPVPAAVYTGYEKVIRDDSPAAYWRLGEPSGYPQDSAGTNHVTATTGSPTYSVTGALSGDANTSITLSSTQYFSVPHAGAVDLGNGPWTIEFWYRRDSDLGTAATIISKGTTALTDGVLINCRQGTPDIMVLDKVGMSGYAIGATGDATADGLWHHWVCTRSGAGAGNTLWYRDGVEGHADSLPDITFGNTDLPLLIGMENGQTSLGPSGGLDEIALYNVVLSATQVLAHYNAGAPSKVLAFADAVTNSAAWTRTATLARSVADSVTISTAWNRVLTLPRAFADAVTTSDAWTRTISRAMAFADSLTVATAWTRALTLSRAISDSVTTGDAWVRVLTAVRAWSDAVTVGTTWTRTLTLARGFADTVTVGTAWARVLTAVRTFADSVTTSDAWTRVATLARDFADSVSASADHILEKMGVKTLAFADAVTTSDAWTRVLSLARGFADSVTSADTWTRILTLPRTFADAVTTSDAWTRVLTLPRTFADAVTTSDAWSRAVTAVRSFADAVTTSDAAEFVKQGAQKVLDFADAVTTSDAWTRTLTLARAFADAVTTSDAWTRALTLARSFADAVTTSDAWMRISARIHGNTRTCTGTVLPFTTIDVFRSSDNAWVGTTVSDALGHYSIEVAPGVEHYLVAFSATNVYGVTARDIIGD